MNDNSRNTCPDCNDGLSRRDFVRAIGGVAAAGGAAPWLLGNTTASAAPTPSSTAETVVKQFYDTLTESQRKVIAFPFRHQLRMKHNANWAITEPAIDDDFYSDDQRKLIDDIVRGVTSPDGYNLFMRQMEDDDGGIGAYHVAVFGKPGSGKFEWELTGRHMTLRADGDSVDNMAFGGPIIYGHGQEDPKDNLYHYQTKKANEVFAALDPAQRKEALVAEAPGEAAVPLQGAGAKLPGVSVGSLSSDQVELVESVVKVILAPYRKEDVDEALAVLKAGGGLKSLNMAFYKSGDLNDDHTWDIWRVEGPSFVWHFRGAPHVHTYVNIGVKK